MNYSQYITRLGQLMVVQVTNAALAAPFADQNANAILPGIIDYAEQRMYRDIDLVETVTSLTAPMVASVRTVAVPAGVVVMNQMNVITPAGANPDDAGATRTPLRRVSVDFMNLVAPTASASDSTGVPTYFANKNNSFAIVAMAPNAAYNVEFVGTIRPPPLSSANVSTILTTYLPDLFLIASMVFASGYQKNWSMKADDPRMPVNWESQYQANLQSSVTEEARKKAQSSGWQPYAPTPIATPPRGA